MKPDPRRFELEIYPYQIELITRFADLDPGGHVNNVAMAAHFENARVRFDIQVHGKDVLSREMQRVVAAIEIAFVREAFFPAPLTCGVGVSRLGTSSYDLAAAMFQERRCVAVHNCTLVLLGPDGPQALTDEFKTRFAPFGLRTRF